MLPRGGGAFFRNSHQAASPTSSDPRNSRKPSSGAAGCADDAGGEGGGAGGAAGGVAPALAHSAPNNRQLLPKPATVNLRSRSRIRGLIRERIKIDVVLQHIHRISRTFVRGSDEVKVLETCLCVSHSSVLVSNRRTDPQDYA